MTETDDIHVIATCSECGSMIGKVDYEPGEWIEDHAAGTLIRTASCVKPRFCKVCGARFKTIFWHEEYFDYEW